MKYLRTILI